MLYYKATAGVNILTNNTVHKELPQGDALVARRVSSVMLRHASSHSTSSYGSAITEPANVEGPQSRQLPLSFRFEARASCSLDA